MDGYLAHHGIKGMKWGIRNDYTPVGKSSSSSSNDVQKAQRRKSIAKKVAIGAAVVGSVALAGIAYKTIKTNNAATKLGQSYSKSLLGDSNALSAKAASKLLDSDLAAKGFTRTGPMEFSWSK